MRHPRSILITGASSGIGAALAQGYAAPGVKLALTGRHAARLESVAQACRAMGAEAETAALEITDVEPLMAWINAVDRRQPLDLVIASAGMTGGVTEAAGVEALKDVQRMMAVNFEGAANTIHAAIPSMRERRRGQLALMSSLAALRGLPYSPAYCASKAALKAYGEALRARLRPDGIAVSVILPGFVDTPLSRHIAGPKPLMMPPERAARIIRRGLARDSAVIAFPLLLYVGTGILAMLPSMVADPCLNAVRVAIRRYE
jgi:short-subunit dehydrogenase